MAPGPGACDHSETMTITIQLLGRPSITRGSSAAYKLRSRKSWGLLAYLILSERPAARSQLASLLFAEADDPVRALRWCLAEIRRALGDEGSVDGDPGNGRTAKELDGDAHYPRMVARPGPR